MRIADPPSSDYGAASCGLRNEARPPAAGPTGEDIGLMDQWIVGLVCVPSSLQDGTVCWLVTRHDVSGYSPVVPLARSAEIHPVHPVHPFKNRSCFSCLSWF